MNIDGIPESITREQFTNLLKALGLDAHKLREIEADRDGISAIVYVTDDKGKLLIDKRSDTAATHRIYIPVVD